jgi:hypothetical protein
MKIERILNWSVIRISPEFIIDLKSKFIRFGWLGILFIFSYSKKSGKK